MTPEQLKEISRICPRWRDRPLAEIVAAVERVQAEPAAIAAHEAQQPSTDLPTFAHGVAARKWASLQADGFRMQSLKFERADGKTGEINPWGVVTWDVVGAPPQPMVQAVQQPLSEEQIRAYSRVRRPVQLVEADATDMLRADLAEEQRLNGMGAEREARLMAQVFELRREVERLRATKEPGPSEPYPNYPIQDKTR